MALSVSPEYLSAVSAQLGVEEATVSSWLASAKSFSAPTGPGSDDVSIFVANALSLKGADYFHMVQPGVTEINAGRVSVEATGITYDAEDIADSGSIAGHNVGFAG